MASKFLKIRCKKCKNEQIIFEKPAMVVRCNVCDNILAEPTGGKGRIKTSILGVMR